MTTAADVDRAMRIAHKAAREREVLASGLDLTSVESILTHPDAIGITTATPLQRGICRIIDGRPLGELPTLPILRNAEAYHDDIQVRSTWQWSLGFDPDTGPVTVDRPTEVYAATGIRGAKSHIEAATAIRASQTVDLSGVEAALREGENPRISILSIDKDKAKETYDHLVNPLRFKPALRHLLVGEPRAEGVTLRHPSGVHVDVMVVAGKRAGASVISRWAAGIYFDEATRMFGQSEGVVNFDDSRTAGLGRLLPGAQLLAFGSPWAPMGPVYNAVQKYHGKPTNELVVIRGTGPAMNPIWWTAERCEKIRRTPGSEQTWQSDVLGEFVDAVLALIASGAVEARVRRGAENLEYDPRNDYAAFMDPATRRNAWTLVILTKGADDRIRVAFAKQWQGTPAEPLDVDATLLEARECCMGYGLDSATTDQWAADPIVQAARKLRNRDGDPVPFYLHIHAWKGGQRDQSFIDLGKAVETGSVAELHPDPSMAEDLKRLQKKVTQRGIAVDLPETADGRHCDYAPPLAMGVSRWLAPPAEETKPPDAEERERAYKADLRAKQAARENSEEHDTWQEDLVGW